MSNFEEPEKTGMNKFGCLGPTFLIIAVAAVIVFAIVMFALR